MTTYLLLALLATGLVVAVERQARRHPEPWSSPTSRERGDDRDWVRTKGELLGMGDLGVTAKPRRGKDAADHMTPRTATLDVATLTSRNRPASAPAADATGGHLAA